MKHLYTVVHHTGYGRDKEGKKKNPQVFRALLNNNEVIVGTFPTSQNKCLTRSLSSRCLPGRGHRGILLLNTSHWICCTLQGWFLDCKCSWRGSCL